MPALLSGLSGGKKWQERARAVKGLSASLAKTANMPNIEGRKQTRLITVSQVNIVRRIKLAGPFQNFVQNFELVGQSAKRIPSAKL